MDVPPQEEDDGVEIVDADVLDDNPEVLQNQDPALLVSTFMTGKLFLEEYGWFILFGIIVLILLYNWFEPYITKWLQRRKDQAYYSKYHGQTFQDTYAAMQQARDKMQEENIRKTEVFVQQEKEREEKKRQRKLEKLTGTSFKLNSTSETTESETKPKPKPKSKNQLSSDYLPMAGSSGGTGFRPSRRNFAGG